MINSQLNTAQKNLNRLKALKAENAATDQQLDEVEGTVEMLINQKKTISTQKTSVIAETETMNVRIAQVQDQIKNR